MTVAENIAFGMEMRKTPKDEIKRRVTEVLDMVRLGQMANRKPKQLSGGQQQRIALARALAPRPRLLLMDEPFSSMDSDLRESLARDVRDILHQEQVSAILVTHDQFEAFAMSDEIGLLRDGELVQWDTGYNLYHRPTNRFVAGFIGQGVLLDAKVHSPKELDTPLGVIKGRVPEDCRAGCPVKVLIRPDDIQHDDASPMTATVRERAFRGAEFLYTLELADGSRVLSLVPSHHDHRIGERIGIVLEVDHLVTFKRQPDLAKAFAAR
jgi:iron(III) transport system ATP-binding protein